ncbi:MAG: cytochrome c oxidase subunit II [Flavobacteriales bacterium]|jgi:cytochrome c oxidase subunit 2|nr:cytochrome c oxidase subunit II [Flavobacteriales bacterium]
MTKLLILLVIILGILAIAQLARVYELTSRLRGKREEDISDADNRFNGRMMLVFMVAYFAFFLWLILAYDKHMLPVAASEHGADIDALMNFNWAILAVAFVITNVLLFWFSYKYIYNSARRAHWYPHNNRLELIWTVIPAAVLAVIIIYGLTTWNRITALPGPGAIEVEIYAKQFDWTARYPGADGVLGASDFRLINGTNPLGVATPQSLATRMAEMDADIHALDSVLGHAVLADNRRAELSDQVERLRRHKSRLVNLEQVMQQDIAQKGPGSVYLAGADDIVTKDFHLPKGREAHLLIRSRDVLHSAYIPHMRAQMNAVPGMTTMIKMTPTITTDSMRTHVMKNDAFDFILLCNKICGASHYNMQMPLIVTTPEEYAAWYKEAQNKPFEAPEEPAAAAPQATEAQADTTALAEQ